MIDVLDAPAPHVDVFISYKREDRLRVEPLVECLRSANLRVWWDAEIPGGSTWRGEILRQLHRAKCVLVIWSEGSVSSDADFVHEEAGFGKQRGILLPVSLDDVSPPLGFGQVQALDLIGWTGDPDDIRVANVIAAARARISGGPLPTPRSVRRRAWRIAAAFAIGLPAVGFVADIATVNSMLCSIPGIKWACSSLGIGGVPTAADERLWASRPLGDCEWLRRYVAQNANGVYAERVARLLQARRTRVEESWAPEEYRLRIYVSAGPAFRAEGEAQADTLSRAKQEAALACSGFAAPAYRVRSARVADESIQWRCMRLSTGTRCSVDANSVCAVDARHSVTREVCE